MTIIASSFKVYHTFGLVFLLHSSNIFDCMAKGEESHVVIDHDGQVERDASSSRRTFGVDSSWPMHHEKNEYLPKHRRDEYSRFLQGCSDQPSSSLFSCEQFEDNRIDMNLNQPKMMENYTYTGFAKVQTPSSIQDILEDFFVANNKHQNTELWDSTNTYINHWISPTSMLNAMSDDPRILHSLSHEERWKVVNGVQLILEAWTKSSLVLTSIYGVRIYKEGTILAPHVDKLPLVTSAIINIAQDVDEPWPLEVIDHLGVARNITMEPGEMILYEGHSVIHGRPYPLKGKFFANLFVHFEPRGHTLRHSEKQRDMFGVTDDSLYENAKSAHENVKSAYENAKSAYENAFQIEMFNNSGERRQEKKQKKVSKLPHYVHSDNEGRWKQHFEYDVNTKVSPKPLREVMMSTTPHNAAASGNMDALKSLADTDRNNLFKSDQNGWRPLHEAARAGHVEVIKYLLKEGAQINERTNNGKGGSPLWWAEKNPDKNKDGIAILKKYGAVSLQPKVLDNKQRNDQKKENKN